MEKNTKTKTAYYETLTINCKQNKHKLETLITDDDGKKKIN